ncbi:MAG: hypothetical protein A3I06_10695 [Candidatus Lindowbacteria bacterium RIFCSPLOWO2_02_FULL_62_12]|nr:MAG: hypothetical protein A3I06_10695 [Candidatus Lindowbacteria bacterium RIFCSPLOWO2_02_FULL_62_12]
MPDRLGPLARPDRPFPEPGGEVGWHVPELVHDRRREDELAQFGETEHHEGVFDVADARPQTVECGVDHLEQEADKGRIEGQHLAELAEVDVRIVEHGHRLGGGRRQGRDGVDALEHFLDAHDRRLLRLFARIVRRRGEAAVFLKLIQAFEHPVHGGELEKHRRLGKQEEIVVLNTQHPLDLLGFHRLNLDRAFSEPPARIAALGLQDLRDLLRFQKPVERRKLAEAPVQPAVLFQHPLNVGRPHQVLAAQVSHEGLASREAHVTSTR